MIRTVLVQQHQTHLGIALRIQQHVRRREVTMQYGRGAGVEVVHSETHLPCCDSECIHTKPNVIEPGAGRQGRLNATRRTYSKHLR
mgnify:CR=1 FL=1